jgi:ubiquinone/menaquinone biosynthesis C-methylase UbiE
LNFNLLQKVVGPEGKIIGVDLTDYMLAQAKNLIEENKWSNVELVECDATKYEFPEMVDGILSTFAITLIPEFDLVIKNGCNALAPGKRFVVLDFKLPSNWLSFLAPLGVLITRPFGVSLEMASRHPWESIDKYLSNSTYTELYGGFAYIATGIK